MCVCVCVCVCVCARVRTHSKPLQSCPTLSDPMDYSLPGSSIHGIFQAGVLEWGAIAFSADMADVASSPPIANFSLFFINT